MPMATQATPPVLRTPLGEMFCLKNKGDALVLQKCSECDAVQYPPRERCRNCLADSLVWSETNNAGNVLAVAQLHHSQGEFFLVNIKAKPWTIATVSLAGQCLFVHLASATFSGEVAAGSEVKIMTCEDTSGRAVLIGVSPDTDISNADKRSNISKSMGLT
jgi:uncharacterized OB-fold protein